MTVSFERFAAHHLELQSEALTHAWLREIGAEMPGGDVPERMPPMLGRVAQLLRDDDDAAFASDPTVLEGVRALARQGGEQGRDAAELVRQLHRLARLLDSACLEWLSAYPGAPQPASVLRVTGRLNRAPMLMAGLGTEALQEPARPSTDARRGNDFARILLHELRTPLNAAELAALILEDDDLVDSAQERRRFAVVIQRSLRRVSTVIDDAWRLAEVSAPEHASGRSLPLPRLLDEVLAQVRESVLAAGARVEVEGPVPEWSVDASRLEPILLNLLGNAARYADPSRDVHWVRIRFGEGGGERWLEVSDNGLGIPREHQRRIFERFFRAHPEHAEGTGLGLAIAHEAASQLGGRIELQSEPGVGSTFRVVLPIRDTELEVA